MFNFFKKKKGGLRKINITALDTLLLQKGVENIVEVNGITYKKIKFRVVGALNSDIETVLSHLEQMIAEKDDKISMLTKTVENLHNTNNDVLHLYKNTYTNFFNEQKKKNLYTNNLINKLVEGQQHNLELKKFSEEIKRKLVTAEKKINAMLKFQFENNLLKEEIKHQDKIIKNIQSDLIDEAYETKQLEKIVVELKNQLTSLKHNK